MIKVTTRTTEEIDAAFADVFKAIQPLPTAKALTQEDRLAPYRKAVLKQRRRGLSWRQIAQGMTDPRIGEHVSDKLLRRVFGAADPAARDGSKPGASAEAPTEVKPPVRHLILDPLTGQRIS